MPVVDFEDDDPDALHGFVADLSAAGLGGDAYLAQAIPDVSRARVRMLIDAEQVRVDGALPKAKDKLKGGALIQIQGQPRGQTVTNPKQAIAIGAFRGSTGWRQGSAAAESYD